MSKVVAPTEVLFFGFYEVTTTVYDWAGTRKAHASDPRNQSGLYFVNPYRFLDRETATEQQDPRMAEILALNPEFVVEIYRGYFAMFDPVVDDLVQF